MKTSHSSKSDISRKRYLLGMITVTALAVAFCTSLGIMNDFNELINYTSKDVVSILLSAVALGTIATSCYRMIRSNEINRTGNIA